MTKAKKKKRKKEKTKEKRHKRTEILTMVDKHFRRLSLCPCQGAVHVATIASTYHKLKRALLEYL